MSCILTVAMRFARVVAGSRFTWFVTTISILVVASIISTKLDSGTILADDGPTVRCREFAEWVKPGDRLDLECRIFLQQLAGFETELNSECIDARWTVTDPTNASVWVKDKYASQAKVPAGVLDVHLTCTAPGDGKYQEFRFLRVVVLARPKPYHIYEKQLQSESPDCREARIAYGDAQRRVDTLNNTKLFIPWPKPEKDLPQDSLRLAERDLSNGSCNSAQELASNAKQLADGVNATFKTKLYLLTFGTFALVAIGVGGSAWWYVSRRGRPTRGRSRRPFLSD